MCENLMGVKIIIIIEQIELTGKNVCTHLTTRTCLLMLDA